MLRVVPMPMDMQQAVINITTIFFPLLQHAVLSINLTRDLTSPHLLHRGKEQPLFFVEIWNKNTGAHFFFGLILLVSFFTILLLFRYHWILVLLPPAKSSHFSVTFWPSSTFMLVSFFNLGVAETQTKISGLIIGITWTKVGAAQCVFSRLFFSMQNYIRDILLCLF